MPKTQTMVDLSSSVSIFSDRKDLDIGTHFRWQSIKKFIYLAYTFSSSLFTFDLFSKVCHNGRIFDFVICEATIGIAYMCMDCFIKQYTRRLDCNKHLNPLLRGITFGTVLQTGFWTVLHAVYLTDFVRFFVASLSEVPVWSRCQPGANSTCVPVTDIILRCGGNVTTNFTATSAYYNYFKAFTDTDKNVMTTRFFLLALVWIFNFLLASVSEDSVIKIFKLAFLCRTVFTIITIIFIIFAAKDDALLAISQMLDISSPYSFAIAFRHVCYVYGIGFLGLFDFGTMSPYTMIDNAVLIFMIIFTTLALIRSWIAKTMYIAMLKCVKVDLYFWSPHVHMFALLPLSTEFFYAHKLYMYYIYLDFFNGTLALVSMLTLTLSKFFQNEFRSIKHIYIVGMLCCIGFVLCLPIIMTIKSFGRVQALILGLNVAVLYLGGFRVAIVMWVYGVQRFSTDMLFWLGFKPTKFWIGCWILLPIVLFSVCVQRVLDLLAMENIIPAYVWIAVTVIFVAFFHIKTIARFLVRNNLAGVFIASHKYGAPDPDDRKNRRVYNEIIRLRSCKHNCMLLDEMIDCFHVPFTIKSKSRLSSSSSEPSLMNLYEASTTKNRPSTHAVMS